MRIHLSKQARERRGAVVPLVALSLVAIVGVVAVVIDGGLLRDNRRRVQASADGAALAAAYDLYQHFQQYAGVDTGGSARTSAFTTASANGYTNDTTNSVVTVNIPPTSGNFIGMPGYAEVIIEYKQKRGFTGMWGSGRLPVRGRAVARGNWLSFPNGIIVLDPIDPNSFNANGGSSVSVSGASVIVDSTDAAGAIATGGGTLTTTDLYLSGSPGWSTSGGSTITGTIHSNSTPVPDPLAYLPEPDPATMTIQSTKKISLSGNKKTTLNPGVYQGGISITGGDVTLNPGIYYMQGGGFTFGGSANLYGNGVMIYNAPTSNSDVVSLAGNGTCTLNPMTTGLYAGISIFQERSSTNTVSLTGNGGMQVTGTFYVAGGTLATTGNGAGDVIGSQYISYKLNLGGNGGINIDWDPQKTARKREIGLVE